jgi:membrane protease YdiL (CAAX protease family)
VDAEQGRPGWGKEASFLLPAWGALEGLHWLLALLLPRPLSSLAFLAALLVITRRFLASEGLPSRDAGLTPGLRWGAHYLAGFLAGCAVIGAAAALAFAAGGFRLAAAPTGGPAALARGALAYLVPALNEELLYRGFLFQRLARSRGPGAALAALSFLFAAAHLANPGMAGARAAQAFLNILLAGVLLGLGRLATRSLALPMGLHLGWNWAQGSLFGFGVSGIHAEGRFAPVLRPGLDWLTGGPFGLEGGLACTLATVAACWLFALLAFRRGPGETY